MVGEAYGHVQGESLKPCAVFLWRLLNSPITRGAGMLTAIGLTLVIAAMTAALGFEGSVARYARYRDARSRWSIFAQGLMTMWFFIAGMWTLLQAMR
jgi:hypothetical protein